MTYPITSVPPPPKRKKYIRNGLLTAGFIATAAVSCAVGQGIGNSDAPVTSPPPVSSEPNKPRPDKPAQKQVPERKDLVSFKIDDRSIGGSFTNVWVTFTVQNHSSEKSDYTWDWEALNSKGVRVADGSELVSNVLPGQTSKGASPTTLDTANVTLRVTDFDRTASL